MRSRQGSSLLSDDDLYLFNEGTHTRLGEVMGAHPVRLPAAEGTAFATWAPNAALVSVIGDWNAWSLDADPLFPRGASGVWEGFVPGAKPGDRYKFHVVSDQGAYRVDKTDPFASYCQVSPETASVVWDLAYEWGDEVWMASRASRNGLSHPMAIYEVHAGSWMRVPGEGHRSLTYRELAERLGGHLDRTGFTHVELLPLMEHPFFGSWGYQITGFFAPTSRYGTPQDFMHLVDHLHQRGYGVILDWVPSHFPSDEHGLAFFDGTHLYEHPDPRRGFHPDWDSYIFDYGRPEVRSFLLSSAMRWLSTYHADGLRVDAVASMLYLDYSRGEGEWAPNVYGGRENLEAVGFLRQLNQAIYEDHPDVQTIAEDSTAWPMVSRPVSVGGLGFGLKWDMGWMHDTLSYVQQDPLFRRSHHHNLTFRAMYAFAENFVLPLSHDEVVYGKRSLLSKMPGDEWQQRAGLRLLLAYLYAQPGKKLLFMGGEFGQRGEWNHDGQLEWDLLDLSSHRGLLRWVADLNGMYRSEPALHELDTDPRGFEWIDADDSENSVVSFLRMSGRDDRAVLVVANFTPVPRTGYVLGVPWKGRWREILNSDAEPYGGAGWGNHGGVAADPVPAHGRPHSLSLTLPPLGCLFLRRAVRRAGAAKAGGSPAPVEETSD